VKKVSSEVNNTEAASRLVKVGIYHSHGMEMTFVGWILASDRCTFFPSGTIQALFYIYIPSAGYKSCGTGGTVSDHRQIQVQYVSQLPEVPVLCQ
jgi:hypothetical protein